MKNKWAGLIGSIIAFPVVWTLFDYIYIAVIKKEPFQFKVLGHLVIPLIVGAVVDYLFSIRKKDK